MDDNLLTATAAVVTGQVEMISLDDGAEEYGETFEDAYKEPIDTSSPIVAVEEMQFDEHEAWGKDSVAANDVEPVETAMVLYCPPAPDMQEEQEWMDAHKAKMEAFAGIEDSIEMRENPW